MQNNLPATFQPRPLPKLADLHHDIEKAFETDELNRLLAQPTPNAFIKNHPIVKVKIGGAWHPLKYVPEDKVRYLLTKIFGGWEEELIEVKQVANSILVSIKLTVINPFSGERITRIGIGAAPLQSDSGTGLSADTVKANAVQIGAPAAASYALKNAAKKLGPIFGGNLNKADAIEFTGNYQGVDIAAVKSEKEDNRVFAKTPTEQNLISQPINIQNAPHPKAEGMPIITGSF